MNYYNYFTEIEEHFVKRRGKHLLVSPMDWGLIAAWRDAGVPLPVALRGIDKAMDSFFSRKQRGSAKINSLCYCHDSVMAEYADYQESRVGESRTDSLSEPDPAEKTASSVADDAAEASEALEYISSIIYEIKIVAEKQHLCDTALEGVRRVLERLEEIVRPLEDAGRIDLEAVERDLGIADGILVEALRAEISAEQTKNWEKEARTELKVYRKKLSDEMYKKIFDNFMRGRVHQKFNIREFSLFRL